MLSFIKLHLKAAQMWLLGRILPFLIGSFMPHTDECWKNYLQMLEIVDMLLAPEISEDEVSYLHILIQQHHETFVEVYPNASVIPKHHFMLHMPRLILQ